MNYEQDRFPLERIGEIQKTPENYRLLQRIPLTVDGIESKLPYKLNEKVAGEKVYSVVFLDTETTGTDYKTSKIIELGMVKATFSMDRKILLSIDRIYDSFEDPHETIPLEIQQLTHITNEMVENHKIDDDIVSAFLSDRPLIVAHNASFDRPFFDKRFPLLGDRSWSCSQRGVKWQLLGSNGAKLEYLLMTRGWFYAAHRADIDCMALLWLMHIEPEAFRMLVETALKTSYKICAINTPFGVKDELKRVGYRFERTAEGEACWYINVNTEEDLKKQQNFLEQNRLSDYCHIIRVDAKVRYKNGGY